MLFLNPFFNAFEIQVRNWGVEGSAVILLDSAELEWLGMNSWSHPMPTLTLFSKLMTLKSYNLYEYVFYLSNFSSFLYKNIWGIE